MQMEKEDRHVGRVVRTSIGTVTQVSIESVESEGRKQIMGRSIDQNTNHALNMAISVYEYARGEKCVYMLTYT